MKYYLIEFVYEGWCQGPERMRVTELVYANSYNEAVKKIAQVRSGAREFKNMTIE